MFIHLANKLQYVLGNAKDKRLVEKSGIYEIVQVVIKCMLGKHGDPSKPWNIIPNLNFDNRKVCMSIFKSKAELHVFSTLLRHISA